MGYPESFLQTHGTVIVIIIVVLLTLLTMFQILGISFAEPSGEKIDKVVTIETMEQRKKKSANVVKVGTATDPSSAPRDALPSLKPQWAGSACATYSSQPHQLEAYCTNLSDSGCALMDCCVWLNGERCAAGDHAGPTFHNVDVKYYRFKNKCTGNCPAKIE
tara:strand:+ start:305 stop:790 length:486 start_codon:yes stop_codon:yes gene_type:complete